MNQSKNSIHKTVLLQPALDYLDIKPGNWYIDATLGGAGHTVEILKKGGHVLGIDQDQTAIERAGRFLSQACPGAQFQLAHASFEQLDQIIAKLDSDQKFSGILFDLGISSDQLDTPHRGFSFQGDDSLDMRMDTASPKTAADLVNTLTQKQLELMLRQLGDEPKAKAIARKIVDTRDETPITSTKQLAELISQIYSSSKPPKIHPATKTFQALRIAVNRELDQLISVLPQAWNALDLKGRLVVISFHSGEDRIVKHFLRYHEQQGNGQILTTKPVTASDQEIARNSRSRSAKLRAIQKIK